MAFVRKTSLLSLAVVALAFSGTWGCAARGPASYRLINASDQRLLIPPGVKHAGVTQRSIRFRTAATPRPCEGSEGGIALTAVRKGLRLAVDREALEQQPAGWLAQWAVSLEERGCLAAGEGFRLATRVAQSVPLPLRVEQRLLTHDVRQSGFTDLLPGYRVRVVSPVFREGAPPDAQTTVGKQTVEGSPGGLTVSVQTSPDLIGYEMAWYAVELRPQGGARIVPQYADFHQEGEVARQPAPRVNHLDFDPKMAYFRMMVMARRMTDSNDHDIFLVAAPTQPLLDQRSRALEAGASACGPVGSRSSAPHRRGGGLQAAASDSAVPRAVEEQTTCAVAPSQVAVVAFIPVRVQGKEVLIHPGATLAGALREAGADVDQALPTLGARKPYGSKLASVKALGEKTDLLRLPLSGGEEIAW
jgi:hypothetical protein